MRIREFVAGLVLAAMAAAGNTAHPTELTVGLASETGSLDPHYHYLIDDLAVHMNIYEPLILQDEKQRLKPGLAESWQAIDENTWEFSLRKGVKFHDGTELTAKDVIASIRRAPTIEKSPGSYEMFMSNITDMEKVDSHTIRFSTDGPYPMLPGDLSMILIVPEQVAKSAKLQDFNAGEAAVGTGPYKLVDWTPRAEIKLARHSDYWGESPKWESVTLRMITTPATRVAALLAGDVDVIERVPTTDVQQLKNNSEINVSQGPSNRVIYLHIDTYRDQTPFATDQEGNVLDKNPLKDKRVREALSQAIDREMIVARVMEGLAIPAGQLLPPGFYGRNPDLEPEAYEPEHARALLTEAGYPDGFGLTIHGPNNRYINDEKIAQAIAQMLTRIGIDTKVDTMPANVYWTKMYAHSYSFMVVGWGSSANPAVSVLKALVATPDKERGMGATNYGRYSNPEFDRLLEEALVTVDSKKREQLLAKATGIAIQDYAVVPLHYQVNTWASRSDFEFVPRTDEMTLIRSIQTGQ